jgi:transposase InsO family protein
VWAYLRYVEKLEINKKRVYRIMKENSLLVKKNQKLKAKREAKTKKPRPDKPNQWWGIDMTKVMTTQGWAYLVIVNDWFTKKILGSFVGSRSRATEWLEAINEAVCRQYQMGIKQESQWQLNLMSDNGSQPTSVSFMREVSELGISQTFTSYNNPKGNADTERLIRTLKEELIWLREWRTVDEVATAIKKYVEYFNENYLHSAIDYKTPNSFEQEWFEENGQKTLLATA